MTGFQDRCTSLLVQNGFVSPQVLLMRELRSSQCPKRLYKEPKPLKQKPNAELADQTQMLESLSSANLQARSTTIREQIPFQAKPALMFAKLN